MSRIVGTSSDFDLYTRSLPRQRLFAARSVRNLAYTRRSWRAPLRCVAADRSIQGKEDGPPETNGAPSYTSRLRNNAAYQRLKARQVPGPADASSSPSSSPPDAGRQAKDGTNTPSPTPASVQPPNPPSAANTKPQPLTITQSHTPGRNQSVSFRPPNPGPSPPPFSLQPISARQQPPSSTAKFPQPPQQSPYALTKPQPAPPRHIDFAEPAKQQDKALAQVDFWLTFHAEFGQRLRVVGSHSNLGSWVLVDGPELKWTDGDRWHAKIDLPGGSVYEYKYVLLDSSGTNALNWQRGNNSVLAIKQDEPVLEVFDNWEGQPGAAVMAGGKSSTRESKLLAWATDMEAQLTSQRQELRRSRIELASAQEDARKARQEARAVRMELAQSQSVRAQADQLIRQLQSSNRMLKSELSATTTSFKQALLAAQTRLQTVEEEEEKQFTPRASGQQRQQPASGPSPGDTPGSSQGSEKSRMSSKEPKAGSTPDVESASSQTSSQTTGMPPSASSQPAVQPLPVPKQAAEASSPAKRGDVSDAESTTSSNARQNSTAETTALGVQSSVPPTGAADAKLPAEPDSESRSSQTVPGAEDSQPQLEDLPKHSKQSTNTVAASPPKTPGSFPDSAPSSNADAEVLPASEAAGRQLEMTRTSTPPGIQTSNAAAKTGAAAISTNDGTVQSDATASGQAINKGPTDQSPAGEELQQTQTDVPPRTDVSNAAANKAPGKKRTSPPVAAQDQPADQELQQTPIDTPLKPEKPGATAKQVAKRKAGRAEPPSALDKPSLSQSQSASSSVAKPAPGGVADSKARSGIAAKNDAKKVAAGSQLQASSSGTPPGVQQSNAAANQAPSGVTAGSNASSTTTLASAAAQDPQQAIAAGSELQSKSALDLQGANTKPLV